MDHRLPGSLVSHGSASGRLRQCVATMTVWALALALAGPLFVSWRSGDPIYCCRSGRCCCDAGQDDDDPGGFDLKAACRCARPDGSAVAFAFPLGLLVPDAPGPDLAGVQRVAPRPGPSPRTERAAPLDHPPRLSRTT